MTAQISYEVTEITVTFDSSSMAVGARSTTVRAYRAVNKETREPLTDGLLVHRTQIPQNWQHEDEPTTFNDAKKSWKVSLEDGMCLNSTDLRIPTRRQALEAAVEISQLPGWSPDVASGMELDTETRHEILRILRSKSDHFEF